MKKVASLVFAGMLLFALMINAGCGSKPSEESTGNESTQTEQSSQTGETGNTEEQTNANAEAVGDLTKENPLKVNKEEGTVSFLAQVNGKYFYEPTRHGAVFVEGSNGEKAIFRGFADPESYYNALNEVGAKAGNNMTLENKEKTNVQGDAFDVSVTWTGSNKEYKLDEVVKDSNGKPIEVRFGGNLKNAQEKKTGCLICLDSCPVGVTSNTTYTYGAVEGRKEVQFTGNNEVLPADGTFVAVTLKLKK